MGCKKRNVTTAFMSDSGNTRDAQESMRSNLQDKKHSSLMAKHTKRPVKCQSNLWDAKPGVTTAFMFDCNSP